MPVTNRRRLRARAGTLFRVPKPAHRTREIDMEQVTDKRLVEVMWQMCIDLQVIMDRIDAKLATLESAVG